MFVGAGLPALGSRAMFVGAGDVRGRGLARAPAVGACAPMERGQGRAYESANMVRGGAWVRTMFVGAGLPALGLWARFVGALVGDEARMAFHQSHLLRKGRFSEPGRAYLVSTVTEGRNRHFADWRVGRDVVYALVDSPVDTLAWVLMPDHLHWLLQLHDATLSDVVGSMKSRSARAVNARLGRTGSVWQKGFHDHAVRAEEDLRALARYVVANPLRAGLVRQIGDYPLWDALWL